MVMSAATSVSSIVHPIVSAMSCACRYVSVLASAIATAPAAHGYGAGATATAAGITQCGVTIVDCAVTYAAVNVVCINLAEDLCVDGQVAVTSWKCARLADCVYTITTSDMAYTIGVAGGDIILSPLPVAIWFESTCQFHCFVVIVSSSSTTNPVEVSLREAGTVTSSAGGTFTHAMPAGCYVSLGILQGLGVQLPALRRKHVSKCVALAVPSLESSALHPLLSSHAMQT